MILEMLSHARQLSLHRNASGVKNVLWPNTAEHQHLRAANGPTGEDNLLSNIDRVRLCVPGARILDPASGEVPRGRGR